MSIIKNVLSGLSYYAGVTKLKTIQYGPEIAMVAGVVVTGYGIYKMCTATLKVESVIDEAKAVTDKIHESEETHAIIEENGVECEYTHEDAVKDLTTLRIQTIIKFAKLYAIPFVLVAGGIALMIGGHWVLLRRNMSLAAAYTALQQAFTSYRGNVVADQGKQKDYEYRFGKFEPMDAIKSTVTDENGNQVTTEEAAENLKLNDKDARWLFSSQTSPRNWKNNRDMNAFTVMSAEKDLTQLLRNKSFITRADAKAKLDMPITKEDFRWGKKYNPNLPAADNVVSLGMVTFVSSARQFINGEENDIILEPDLNENLEMAF